MKKKYTGDRSERNRQAIMQFLFHADFKKDLSRYSQIIYLKIKIYLPKSAESA